MSEAASSEAASCVADTAPAPVVPVVPVEWIVSVDSEWDVADHTRLACVTMLRGRVADVLAGRWEACQCTLIHGRDPQLADALISLFSDPTVLTVWMTGANDVCVYAQAPGLGKPVVRAYYVACLAGRVSDLYQREILLWTAFPDWVEWWQVGTRIRYVPPTAEGKAQGKAERPWMTLDALLYRWCCVDVTATKTRVSKSKSKTTPRKAKPVQPSPFAHAEQLALPGGSPPYPPAELTAESVRLTYGPLVDVALELWSDAHKTYAVDDTLHALQVWRCQALMRPVVGQRSIWTRAGKPAAWPFSRDTLATLLRRMTEFVPLFRNGTPAHGLLPGEQKMVCDALPATWLCEFGGLYADSDYIRTMIARYETGLAVCAPVVRAAGLFAVGKPGTGEAGAVPATASLDTKAKRALAFQLFDLMSIAQPGWAPLLTKVGERAFSRDATKPWTSWPVHQRKFAACSTKIVREILEALCTGIPQHSNAQGTGAVDLLAAGKIGAAELQAWADTATEQSPVFGAAWCWAVWYKCQSMLSGFLRPIAATLPSVDTSAGGPNQNGESGPGASPRPISPERWYPLITGRWSLVGLLRQNGTRTGGSRESMGPREGWRVFLADLAQIELLGFAEAIGTAYRMEHPEVDQDPKIIAAGGYCSSLKRVIQAGKDAHIILAGNLLPLSNEREWLEISREAVANYSSSGEWVVHDCMSVMRAEYKAGKKKGLARTPTMVLGELCDDKREQSKRLNYGLGGMMRPARFIITQRAQGDTSWTLVTATSSWKVWRGTWYETDEYETVLKKMLVAQRGMLRHQECDRLRGGLELCSMANTIFQTPIAEGFKTALRREWSECVFQDPPVAPPVPWPGELPPMQDSPLYGCIVVAPIHDEIVSVGPLSALTCAIPGCKHDTRDCPTALARKQIIMRETMAAYLPGLSPTTDGAILTRFSKG